MLIQCFALLSAVSYGQQWQELQWQSEQHQHKTFPQYKLVWQCRAAIVRKKYSSYFCHDKKVPCY